MATEVGPLNPFDGEKAGNKRRGLARRRTATPFPVEWSKPRRAWLDAADSFRRAGWKRGGGRIGLGATRHEFIEFRLGGGQVREAPAERTPLRRRRHGFALRVGTAVDTSRRMALDDGHFVSRVAMARPGSFHQHHITRARELAELASVEKEFGREWLHGNKSAFAGRS